MGVLEDAIRDHLALKRRHGAADEELRRQEAEALGAARRGGTAAPAEHEADAEGDRESMVSEPPRAAPPVEELAPEEAPVDAVDEDTVIYSPSDAQPEPGPAPEPEGLELEIGPEPRAKPEPEERKEPPADALPPVTEDGDPVEDEAPRQEEPATKAQPEPEQDRLRFERKPPADLDFD